MISGVRYQSAIQPSFTKKVVFGATQDPYSGTHDERITAYIEDMTSKLRAKKPTVEILQGTNEWKIRAAIQFHGGSSYGFTSIATPTTGHDILLFKTENFGDWQEVKGVNNLDESLTWRSNAQGRREHAQLEYIGFKPQRQGLPYCHTSNEVTLTTVKTFLKNVEETVFESLSGCTADLPTVKTHLI